MSVSKLLLTTALIVPAFVLAQAAHAQSIDYGALQQVFNEPVTTSATGSPQRSTEAPVSMEIISADDIRRSGATDIPSILARAAGVDILSWGAGGASDIGVGGYDSPFSPRLLVLINGRQVYLDHYGYTAWSTLPVQLSEIRQIEIVKGPNSALFGFNAVGGVVNIITYNPKYDAVNAVEVGGGSQGFKSVSGAATFKIAPGVTTRIAAGADGENQWKDPNGATPSTYKADPYRSNADLDTVVQLGPKTELRIEGSWSSVEETDLLPTYAYSATRYLTDSYLASLDSETKLGLVSFEAYRNDLTAKYNSETGYLAYKNNITVAKAQDLFKLGSSSTFRIAGEYRHNELNTQPISGGTISYDVWSASAMWNQALTSQISTTAAVRYDNLQLSRSGSFPVGFPLADNSLYDRTIGETTANLGVVYKATPLDTVRVSYARGVQIPSLVDLGGVNVPYPVSTPYGPITVAVIGEPFVHPTVVQNYEVGYDRTLDQISATFGARVFRQETAQLVGNPTTSYLDLAPTLTTYPAIYFADNIGSSTLNGVETRAKGQLPLGFRWGANWTFTRASVDMIAGQSALARQIDFSQMIPHDRGNLELGWSGGRWELDGHVRYVSSFTTAISPLPQGDYVSFDGRIGYELTDRARLALSFQNVGSSGFQDTILKADHRVILSAGTHW